MTTRHPIHHATPWAALAQPLAAAFGATELGRRVAHALARQREIRRVRAELASYSQRELMTDLRLTLAEVDGIAAQAPAAR